MKKAKALFQNVVDWSAPHASTAENGAERRNAALVIAFTLALAPWALIFSWIYTSFLNDPAGGVGLLCMAFTGLFTPAALRWTQSSHFAANYLATNLFGSVLICAWTIGERATAPLIWFISVPLLAVVLSGAKSGIFWSALSCVSAATFGFLRVRGVLPPSNFSSDIEVILVSFVIVTLTLLVGSFAIAYDSLKNAALRQAQQALRNLESMQAQLVDAQKMAALGEMSGGVAHEINTPLAIIQLVSENARMVLDDDQPDLENLKKFLDTITKTTLRIARIVAGLRSFSRHAGSDPIVEASLHEIVESTLGLCQEKFRFQQVSIEIPKNISDVKILCRPVEVSQALLNLLNNSFDAINENPSEKKNAKWIRIEAREEASHWALLVSDSGPGIPASIRPKIFQPFYTTKEVGKGTGLGLSISKGLIEAQGGLLALDEKAERTTFVMTLKKAA